LLTFAGTGVRAQISLTGTVHSQTENEPLPGAYVYPQNSPSLLTTTDAAGTFSLELPAPDTLIVSFLGYTELRRYVATSGQLDLRLTTAADLQE
ncbi:MAG: carboxypeptidase-like regulatory domain-containing protein, partial [Bacteroidota bacterium]